MDGKLKHGVDQGRREYSGRCRRVSSLSQARPPRVWGVKGEPILSREDPEHAGPVRGRRLTPVAEGANHATQRDTLAWRWRWRCEGTGAGGEPGSGEGGDRPVARPCATMLVWNGKY